MGFKVGKFKSEKIKKGFGRIADSLGKVGKDLADKQKKHRSNVIKDYEDRARRDKAELNYLRNRDKLEQYKRRNKKDQWGF